MSEDAIFYDIPQRCEECNGSWTGLFVTAKGRLCYDCLYEIEPEKDNGEQ